MSHSNNVPFLLKVFPFTPLHLDRIVPHIVSSHWVPCTVEESLRTLRFRTSPYSVTLFSAPVMGTSPVWEWFICRGNEFHPFIPRAQWHFAQLRGSSAFLAPLAYLWLTCLLPWPLFQTVIVPKDLLTLHNVLGSVIHFNRFTVYCDESDFCQLHHGALWPTQARVQTWVLLCRKHLLLSHRVSLLSPWPAGSD